MASVGKAFKHKFRFYRLGSWKDCAVAWLLTPLSFSVVGVASTKSSGSSRDSVSDDDLVKAVAAGFDDSCTKNGRDSLAEAFAASKMSDVA